MGTLKIAVVLVVVFNLREAPRIILKLEIEGSRVDMLYDSGSTYSIITQNTYDSLKYKLPLTPVNKSGITISQERFEIQGVAFVNIKFKREDNSEFILEYHPVLVSLEISSNPLGMHTDLQFKAANFNHIH